MKNVQRVMVLVCLGYSILVMYCCMFCGMPDANRLGFIISAGVMALLGWMMDRELRQ